MGEHSSQFMTNVPQAIEIRISVKSTMLTRAAVTKVPLIETWPSNF